jgi:antitoxin component of RelBE/YafQ-DinJ toxin-antitoxin module
LSVSDKEIRNKLYNAFKDISEKMGLTGSSKIEEALNIIKDTAMFFFDEEQWLDDNDIISALTSWKHDQNPESEDATADHLVKDNEKLERINEDPFEIYY